MRADSDFSPAVTELLDRYTPLPQIEPDWETIQSRNVGTSPPGARRRLVPLAAALAAIVLALAVVTPLGGAVRNKLGDFSTWLQGTPGEPVSEEEQRAFDQANATWGSFPGSPQLRQLADVEAGGASYRLLGFRSEGSLCLRIVARGSARGSTLMCAPVSDLRNDEAPARVLVADWGVGRGTKTKEVGFDTVRSAHAQVTAGIAADGVEAIELIDDQGRHRVPTESNAFIYVAAEPEVGQRVTKVQARLDDERLFEIPLAVAPFGGFGGFGGVGGGTTNGEPGGPTKIERRVVGGRIGWLDRRENRGESVRDVFAGRAAPQHEVVFGRLLTPDPSSSKRVAIVETLGSHLARPGDPPREMICTYVVARGGIGGGCNPADDLFPRSPFSFGWSTIGGGDQFATFAGMASDEVARLEAFTATGNAIPVPLADNSYLIEIAIARFPVKLVAYDSQGRVIGIERTPRDEVTGRVVGPPIVEKSVEIPEGGSATLRAHHTEDGGQCWFMRGTGALRMSTSGCTPRDWQKAPVRVGPIGAKPLIAVGRARSDVVRIVFRFDNGSEASFTPDDEGYVFQAFPEPLRQVSTRLTEIRALGADGAIIDRQRVDRPPGG
jgi:hypothetical protein